MACPAPVVNAAWMVTSPRFGTSLQVMVNARGGTVAGVSIPRLKFIVRVPPCEVDPEPNAACRRAPIPAGFALCDPHPAIRPRRDCVGEPAYRHGVRGDRTADGDPTDPIGVFKRNPKGPSGPAGVPSGPVTVRARG